ncbi:MAG: flagellar biosynthetic protein FliR [Planctomycetaceae bacterium]|nr:flagellar biosynthetic protein FliR [Planctomycetaceae bacterium]HCK41928.1 flagellar biosynthetic protein FliR [Planctomycetaceae bacterium]
MTLLETLLINQFATFTLVLARVGALVMSAPIFSSAAIPLQARAFLVVSISLLISPLVAIHPPADMTHLIIYGKYLASEALVGLLLGFGITLFLSGIQVTGQIVSQLGGTAVAEVFDPTANSNVSIYSQLFYFLTLTMFVLLDGHRLVMDALLDTYHTIPPGRASLGSTYVEALTTLLSQSFMLGLRAAAPAMTALLLATLVLGLVGRTMPQINILAVGFGLNALLTLGCLFTSLGAVAWAFPQQTTAALELIKETLRQSVSPLL